MAIPFIAPKYFSPAFNCPHCNAYSAQEWADVDATYHDHSHRREHGELKTSYCQHCQGYCLWLNQNLLLPAGSGVPFPHADLPGDVKEDYAEARSIVNQSPRGSAALLRLGIQRLCKHLGEGGNNINEDIASLVKKGLPRKIQQSLDVVRVIGNNAVHPGELDLKDDVETASALFGLINLIVEVMIAQPKQIDQIYGALPGTTRAAIEKRDGK